MIRLARTADVAAVTSLVNDAYSGYIARNGKVPGPMRDDYAALVAQGRVHVFEDEAGAIIGLVVLIPEPDSMLLDNVAVSPNAQGRGYGVKLIAFAERCARDAGLPAIRLYTQDIMTENIALYAAWLRRNTSRRGVRAEQGLHDETACSIRHASSLRAE